MIPSRIVVTMVIKTAMIKFFFISIFLCQSHTRDQHVNELDSDERDDDAANAVYPEVTTQQSSSAHWPIPHATQGQRNQRDDDYRVKNYSREHGRFGRSQPHDVERVENGKCTCKHRGDDGEVFRHVIGDRE